MVKIGDKVRFLNSVGGGIVRALQGKNMILVEDDNGFDFPTLITECVVVGSDDSLKSSSIAQKGESAIPQQKTKEPQVELKIEETPEGERLNTYLAYLPINPKAMVETNYEAYFINESNYYLFFNYMNRSNNSWTSRYHGIIEPHTKIFLEEFEKSELNSLERICIQLVAYKKDKLFTLKNTYSVELRLDTVKFYKLHCFTENDFFEEGTLIFPVIQHDIPEKQMLVSATEIQEAMLEKKHERPRISSAPAKKSNKAEHVIEVDLHINQLLETTQGMTPADILNYQIEIFHQVLKENATKKGQKIVFIHGKGEGVLRTAIEKELKTRYKSYTYQDASFQEYGFGATMVKIRS